ncbi:hypothetical protein FACS1894205_1180 [Alphaproteobacteria bacterium]|nr:hypothetical protein FACS1894205_1180 [Alphaproteobacteria bacterium]
MFSFTKGKSLPDYGIYGIHRKFSHVNIDMTNRCHNNCVFCEYRENKIKGTMSLDDLFILLTAINDFDGYVSISMTGDPWLLEDLPERIRMIRMFWSKCHIALVSTFNIDKGHEYIDDVFDSGLDELVISCYGYDKRDYRTMHGNDGFDALCKNILHLKNVKNFHKKTVRVDLFSNVDKIIGHTEIERKRCEFLEFIRKSRIVNTFYKPLLSPRGRGQIFPSLSPRGETPPPPLPLFRCLGLQGRCVECLLESGCGSLLHDCSAGN